MRRVVQIFVFLLLTAEGPEMWYRQWKTPLAWSGLVLLKVPSLVACVLAILALSVKARADERAEPMIQALWLCLAGGTVLVPVGLIGGGDLRQALWQVHTMMSAVVFSFALIRILRTPDDFIAVGRVIVYAAVYRAVMCILFVVLVINEGGLVPAPETVTSHHDTVLWLTALFAILIYAFEMKSPGVRKFAYLVIPLLMLAMHYNNRRLAWVSMIGAFITLYFVIPANEAKTRLNRGLLRMSPVILAYLIAGKIAVERGGAVNPVFKPVAALFSSSDSTNTSTKSRDAENMGLLITFMPHLYLGTGFGHEYIEVDSTLSARDFSQYKYVPHNSVLGFVAFGGILGFFAIWGPFPMSLMLNTRAYRLTRDPRVRTVAAVAIAEAVICMVQSYGDMGLFSLTSCYIAAGSWASAARLSMLAEQEQFDSATLLDRV